MSLGQYLEIGRIVVRAQPQDKGAALRDIATLLADGLEFSADEVLGVLEAREREYTTGVGSGVAIPHGRMKVESTRAALLIAPEGVPFDAIDGRDVHLILGVVAPASRPTQLIRMLADASRVLRHAVTRDALLACETPTAVLALLDEFV